MSSLISPSLRHRLAAPISASPRSAAPMDMRRRLKQLDIYRKVPVDLTETSRLGLLISGLALLLLLALAALELRNLFTPQTHTEVTINQDESATIKLYINLTMKRMSCEHIALDLENKLGIKTSVNSQTLQRYSNKIALGGVHRITVSSKQDQEVKTHPELLKREAQQQSLVEIKTVQEFDSLLEQNDQVLVNFYSAKSSASDHFYTVFESVSIEAGRLNLPMRFASVNCLALQAPCAPQAYAVQAYPAVRLYTRQARDRIQVYTGARDYASVLGFAKSLDAGNILELDSKSAAACQLVGHLELVRVPSRIWIHAALPPAHRADSELDLDQLNADHDLHLLYFGEEQTSASYSFSPRRFRSTKARVHHVHYLKIVPRFVAEGQQALQYEYSMSSEVVPASREEQLGGGGVELVLDLSPLQIRVTERTRDFIQALTAMLALLGGVFSATFMLEAMLRTLLFTKPKQ